ncbi:acyltransferase [Vibrio cyclitrophicus]|nr:hypothetical protein [Vibrio cyclitrophicus]UPR47538.1 acyltransferase [Vibrio cyclitrophicus]
MKGEIIIQQPTTLGVKIGFSGTSIHSFERSILDVKGTLIFKRTAFFGSGTKLSVIGDIYFGDKFCVTGPNTIICHYRASFGDNVLISWGGLIMDTDFHSIEINGICRNKYDSIEVGSNVWIGYAVSITKGASIASNSVVSIQSLVNKKHSRSNVLLAGIPAVEVKENVSWYR